MEETLSNKINAALIELGTTEDDWDFDVDYDTVTSKFVLKNNNTGQRTGYDDLIVWYGLSSNTVSSTTIVNLMRENTAYPMADDYHGIRTNNRSIAPT